MQRLLAERGLVISAGKMSGLWSGQPNTVKLDELDVICAVLGCDVRELLVPDPSFVSEGLLVIWAGAAGSDLDDGCNWNITTAPAGLVSSPANSVPTTPGDCSPSPPR